MPKDRKIDTGYEDYAFSGNPAPQPTGTLQQIQEQARQQGEAMLRELRRETEDRKKHEDGRMPV